MRRRYLSSLLECILHVIRPMKTLEGRNTFLEQVNFIVGSPKAFYSRESTPILAHQNFFSKKLTKCLSISLLQVKFRALALESTNVPSLLCYSTACLLFWHEPRNLWYDAAFSYLLSTVWLSRWLWHNDLLARTSRRFNHSTDSLNRNLTGSR